MLRPFLLPVLFAASGVLASSATADWLRFRGPNGSGIAADSSETPIKWSEKENVQWKAALPGGGASSPIVVGQKAFVTCYSGYGSNRQEPGNITDLQRHLVCIDITNGKQLWSQTIEAVQPEDPYSGMGIPAHGYASHTPASDGESVFVFFGKSGVIAFDLDGKKLWQTSVGTNSDPKRWGSASSPIVFGDLVIVVASAESRSLVGLNKTTGEEAWRQKTDGVTDVWGTPVLVKLDDERTDLVIGVPYEFWGLNPTTGKLRWYSEAMNTDSYNSSVVEANGVIYGIEGRGGGSAAVKAGGKGDVTKTQTVWTGNDSARFGTPLVYGGRVYYFGNGIAKCISAEDGTTVFQGRLPGSNNRGNADDASRFGGGRPSGDSGSGRSPEGRFRGGRNGGGFGGRGGFGSMDYASPVAADGKIYYLKNDGTTFVLNAGDKFDLLATNKITADSEIFSGTPAIADGKILLRSNKYLYCVAK